MTALNNVAALRIRSHTSVACRFILLCLVIAIIAIVDSSVCWAEKGLSRSTDKSESSEDPLRQLAQIFEAWQKAPMVKAEIKKTLKTEFLADPRVSEGVLYTSKGLLRMEIKKPSQSLIVVQEKDIWQEERSGSDFIQVNHSQSQKLKQSSGLLALLFGDKRVWNELVVEKEESQDRKVSFSLEPIDKKDWPVKNLKIQVDGKTKTLLSLAFEDELENQMLYEFKNVRFLKKINAKLFQYSPPVGSQINRF